MDSTFQKKLLSRRDALSQKSLQYEQITHLLQLENEDSEFGTLISFQEGIKVGRAFDDVRSRMRNRNSLVHR